jgi:hypothetical protein
MALVHFSKEAIFTHAHRSTARIGTSHARSDATSCSHQKEKEKAQHQKAGILFSLFFVFFRIQGKKEKWKLNTDKIRQSLVESLCENKHTKLMALEFQKLKTVEF